MKSPVTLSAAVLAVLIGASACGLGSDPLSSEGSPSDVIVVGSANFQESHLLASIYSQALQDRGLQVQERFNIAGREVYVPGVEDGSIDLIPEYSGALLQYLAPETEATTGEEVLAALPEALPEGLTVLEASDAENKDVLVVTEETAEQLSLTRISDLEPHANDLVLGAPPEWQTRRNGVLGLEEVYGLEFAEFTSLDAGGPLSLNAVVNGQVDVADLFSTDPSIAEENLVMLEDDRQLFLAENILPLINEDKATPEVTEVLNEVSARLTTEVISEMLARVIQDREDPALAARQWLEQEDLLTGA